MLTHRMHGTLARINGYRRELWGEVTGNAGSFDAGLRQRLLGRLETLCDLSREDARRVIDKMPH